MVPWKSSAQPPRPAQHARQPWLLSRGGEKLTTHKHLPINEDRSAKNEERRTRRPWDHRSRVDRIREVLPPSSRKPLANPTFQTPTSPPNPNDLILPEHLTGIQCHRRAGNPVTPNPWNQTIADPARPGRISQVERNLPNLASCPHPTARAKSLCAKEKRHVKNRRLTGSSSGRWSSIRTAVATSQKL